MNNIEMKNRWIALYVENEVGVLAKVSGLFSAKSYNLQSLTVGTTEDETISRMTICVTSDDITFEQIKKQLNRMVEVIKVIDLTDVPLHMKEILYVRVSKLTREEITDIFQTAQVFNIDVVDKNADSVILESKQLNKQELLDRLGKPERIPYDQASPADKHGEDKAKKIIKSITPKLLIET